MVSINDVVNIKLSKEEILSCIAKTQQHTFLNNLRERHPNIQFDCKLRGYVGELALKKWFSENNIEIEATDYLEDGENIDIDFVITGQNIELKTSLIPDVDGNIENVIDNRDIKIIRRCNDSIEDLKGDVHMQVYYQQRRKAKDNWLTAQKVDLDSLDLDYLYRAFRADAYLNTTYFVAWIDKPTLIEQIKRLPYDKRCWTFPGSLREFWVCPLKYSKAPTELVDYLESLQVKPVIHPLILDSVPRSEQYITYLPLYSIRAACGYFGEGEEVSEMGWMQVEGMGKLNRNMFIVQASGNSMEPRIHDGDYCVFEKYSGGSRQGKIVLAQHRGYFDEDNAGAYSIKQYSSEKSCNDDGSWQHESITLRPFNPEYEPIRIDAEDAESFAIIGELVGVVDAKLKSYLLK